MAAEFPLVRRVDHIIIRIDDPWYDHLMHVLAGTFALPTPWPVNQQPGFKSGGIFAGNVDFEILRVGKSSPPQAGDSGQARLYGIVFEAYSDFGKSHSDMVELTRRRLEYIPSPYIQRTSGKPSATLWLNLFLSGMLGSNRWMKLFFASKRLMGDQLWLRLSTATNSNNQAAARFLFDRVYANGIVFLVKYNPVWRDINAERHSSKVELAARQGGPLGVREVKTITVGVENLVGVQERWHTLLDPHMRRVAAMWRVGDGPAIRLVGDTQNRIRTLVWRVWSLTQAGAFLREHNMLAAASADEITIDPEAICGLDIRLVE